MIKIQQDLCRLLLQKRIQLKESKQVLKGISITTIGRWHAEKSSPSLRDVAHVMEENEINQPFFYDGTISSLMKFSNDEAAKLGMKVTFTFEKI